MRLVPLLILFTALGFLTGATLPQEPAPDQEPQEGPSMLEMMELGQPGPEHAELAKGVGTWDAVSTLTMPPMPGMPEMPPMQSKATTVNEMVLGNRFMRSVSSGMMMGQKTESITYIGFDRRHDEYVVVGLDTMGTYFVTARGKRGEDGVIRLAGSDDDGWGGQDFVFEVDDSDPDRTVTRVIFSKLAGQELDPPHKMVEVVQTRRAEED